MGGYLRLWEGKTDQDDTSGLAHFMVDSQTFSVPLQTFSHAQKLDELLWLAFRQGKSFAFVVVKGRIAGAMADADRSHGLTLDSRRASDIDAREAEGEA